MIKPYYSIKEFAKLLDVHPNTIRNSIRSGRINAFKIGDGKMSVYRIPYSEILRIAEMDFYKRKTENEQIHG